MRAPSARRFATHLAALQVALLTTALIGPALGVVPVPVENAQAAGNAGVQFNGTNQFVTFGNPAGNALGASTFTLEAWFKRTGTGTPTTTSAAGGGGLSSAVALVAKGRGEADAGSNLDINYFLGIDTATSRLAADYEEGAGQSSPSLNHSVIGGTTITNNVWHHAAATFDGTTLRLYLDGVLDATLNIGATRLPRSDSIQHAGIGAALTSTGAAAGFFQGVIDEARIWNVSRSEAQIQAAKNTEIAPTAGLIGAWHLNEGTGTTTANSSGTTINGTLSPVAGPATWATGFDVTNAGVQFNGTNQFVTFGNPAGNALGASTFTLEAWFKRTGTGTPTTTSAAGGGGLSSAVALVAKGRGEADAGSNLDINYFLGIDTATSRLAADYEEGAGQSSPSLNHSVIGGTTITNNVWHHAAATFDGTTLRLYLDGVLDATLNIGATRLPRSDSIQHAGIGAALTSTGAAAGFFQGVIDEARIWNVSRSEAQIQAAKNTEIAPTAGLIGAWHLNEGTGTTTANSSGTTINGTLSPVATAPLWVDGFVPSGVAPNAPTLVFPTNAATGVARPPTLDVTVSDADGGTLDVEFFGRPLASGNYASLGAPQSVASGSHATLPWAGLGGGQTYQWFATVNDGATTTTGPTWTFKTAAETSGTVVIAIGDIASCTETGDTETAAIMAGLDGPILTTGDNVYETGTAAEFAACYEPTWGPFKSRTRPVPGNHDWGNGVRTPASLTDYFAYFGANANQGGTSYYSYDLDADWHVVNLDSECANVAGGGCAAGSDQHDWLLADLAANASKNVIAVWHKPRFSSGATNLVAMADIVNSLYAAGVDLALVGHDHIYEVFQPLDPAGNHDPAFGIRHMTLGTGGAEHHAAGTQKPTSIALNDDTYGVTRLVLHPTSYEWKFFPVSGFTFTDSGSGTVHGAPTPGANGLDLGASGAYVTFGDPSKLDLPTFTIETWFKRTGNGTSDSTGTNGVPEFIPLVTHGGPQGDGSNIDANWLLGIDDATDVLAADFEDTATGSNHPISGSTPITSNVWHHAAATYDGTTWRLYLDGQLDATELESAAPRSDTTQHAGLGVMLDTTGGPANASPARFQGVIDEARVWSGARSLAQIRTTINAELTSGTNLVARWGMSEPSGATVADSIATAANGTIIGSGASRVAGATFDLSFDTTPPAAPTGLGATPGDGTVALTWTANGEPDLAGYNIYRSTTSPVALTSPINGGTLVTSPTYADNSADNDTAFFYVVTAVDDSNNQSTASNEVTATPTGGPQQPTGLDLGSSGAYVTFGDPAKLGLSTFTIETWFKRTGAGVANETGTGGIASFIPIVTHGGPQTEGGTVDANWLLGINDATDVLAADFEDTATGANHPISGTTPLVNGVWYHAAATYDGTTWRLYLNGRLEASETENATPRADTAQHAGLGVMLATTGVPGNSARFQGVIDEARVWTGARNLSQIQSGVHQLPATTTGLVARWSMGQGTGTNVDDGIAPDADGTITGAGTSWPAGAPFDIPTVSAGPNQNVTLPSSALLDGLALDDGQPSTLTTTWSQISGPDSAVIASPSSQSTTVSFTGSGPGDYVFRLTAADGLNTVFDEITVTAIDPGPAPNFGIDFDGTNDYVTFGNTATLGLSQFTLETWFRRDGAGVSTGTGAGGITAAIPLITKGRNESDGSAVDMNYFLGIDASTGRLVADFEEGAAGTTPGLNHPVSGDTVIQTGVWYHAAATYNGTWRIYLNGVLDMTPDAVNQPLRADSTQHAGLGTAMNSGGTAVGAFNGIIDEARIWNTVRTEAQIQAAMTGPLATSPSMVARWSMDEGTGGTIASSAGTTVNGTLTNGPLFVAGTPFVSSANAAPNIPTSPVPGNGATGVSVNPTLEVGVSDPNGGQLTTSFYGRSAGSSAAEDFTIVVIPDTQHYVDSANFLTFNQQTQWIADNEDDLNIVFVSQLGDITENFDTVRQEFDRADAAMDILDNAGIPNNLAPGNHDMSNPGAVTSDLWDEYFPPGRYNLAGNPWYGGWLGEEAGQIQRLNKDNYELFTAGGIDFLIIHLEIDMPTFAVQWADEIIDRYPDRQVILSTHAFLNTSNARPSSRITARADGLSASQVWTQLVAPNCNVFMVVNGHYPGEGRLTSTNSCGQPVHQVLTDYQSRPNGGDGWLRYYTFKPASNTIDARTYSPKFGTFETDATSQFSLTYDMSALAGFELIGETTTASGTTASMPWPGRAPTTGYEWFAVTTDGIANRTSPTWTFTTGGAPSNNPPVVTAVPNQTSAEGSVIDLTVSATDAEDDTLTYGASGLPTGLSMDPTTGHITGTIAFTAAATSPYTVTVSADDPFNAPVPSTFSWTVTNVDREPTFDQDVPDQSNAEGAVITLDAGATDLDGDVLTYAATNLPPGLGINASTGLITGTISSTAAAGSPYSVSVTVRDGVDIDATDTFSWDVSNVNGNPTFDQNLGNRTDPENAVINLDAGGTDPDGDSLTFAATNLPPGLSIDTSTGLITGTIAFAAAAGSPYAVSITVSDSPPGVDATDTFTWTVTDINRNPTFDQDVPNQTSAENAVVNLDAGATDLDGDALIYAASNLPPGLSINASTGLITGTIAFTAAAGSPYSVSVTVRDGATVDATDTFSWTVTDINREPTFNQDLGDRTNAENALINLSAAATDPDGDALTYAATGLPTGLSINTSTGLITGTISATAATSSPYSVSITIRDGATVDATDAFTWTVTNVNSEPTFNQNLPNRTDAENASINLAAAATDLDGDPLTYEATNLPAGLGINASTGQIGGTIAFTAAASSPYAVSITVRDGSTVDATDTFTWTVTNVNREPTFDQDVANQTNIENAVVSLDAGATDLDGDTLVYAANNLPPGLSINTSTGLITGTIAFSAAATSPYSVSVTVRDGATVDATDTFSWTVTNVNREPTFDQDVPNQNHAEGAVVSLDAGGTDIDGDVLTYAATNLPPGLSINTSTGLISGTITFTAASGSPYSVSVTVSDSAPGVDATDTFSWTVTDVAPPVSPTFRSASYATNNATITTLVVGRPATVVAGDLLLASIAMRGSSTITPPAGWTLIRNDLNGNNLRHATWWRFAAASDPVSWTWTFSAGRLAAGAIHAYGGVATTNPIDASSGSINASSTSLTGLGVTTTAANDVLVAFFSMTTNATVTPPTGMTERGEQAGSAPGRTTVLEGSDAALGAAGPTGNRVATASRAQTSVGHLIALRPAAGGPPPVNNEPTFDQNLANRTDPEGTVVNLDAGATDLDNDPLTYAATNLPPGLAINVSTGLITGTIDSSAAAGSPYSVSITVRDGASVDATDTFTWTVTDVPAPNNEPTFDQNLPNRTDPEGTVVNLDAGATDLDNDPLTYAATNLPPGLAINVSTGLITGTIDSSAAAGSPYSVSITVRDGATVDATDTFTWTVTDVPPGSGIAFRAASFGSNNASTTSISLARPTGTVAGDMLIASLGVRGTSTVTAPAGWTLIRTDTFTASLRMHTYWRLATGSDPATWTWTFSGSRLAAGAIHAYSGVHATTPIDASGGQAAGAAAPTATAPSITTTVPNTMLVAFFANMADSTWTAPAGFTERADLIGTSPSQFTSLLSADALRSAAGATGTVTATASQSSGNVAQVIALRPAAGGPPPVNNEPTFDQNLANRTDPEGTVVNLDAGATDLDNDPLTYAATNLPPGLAINVSTGLITGTIDSSAAAGSPYSVSITVRDGASVDATDTFTWTVTDVPPGSGIAFRAASFGSNNASTTSISLARPTGTVAGDMLIASLGVRGTSTVTAPAGWTLIRTDTFTASLRMHTYWRLATGSDPATWTWTFSGSRLAAGAIHAYSGVHATTPIDASGGQAAGAAAPTATAPSITTTVPNTMLVAFFANMADSTWTAPAGFTERADLIGTSPSQFTSLLSADALRSAAGATGTVTATASQSSGNVAQVIALRPAP